MSHPVDNLLMTLQDEARCLVEQGVVHRRQPIYVLFQYLPSHEWAEIEQELEDHEFLPRDPISDLIGDGPWRDD